jgi:hypothetical protein
MGEAGMSFMMMLAMMVMQGSANDVLDLVDSTAYWKVQNVEMTVDALAGQLKTAKPDEGATAASVRRLMAIRGLGELKKKEALADLKPLVNDPTPFVADYARQAIAMIEGTPYKRPTAAPEKLASDVSLLPAGCGVVAQMSVAGGGPISYDKLFELAKTMGPGGNQPDLEQMRGKITEMLVQFTGMVGNFRVEGATVGVAGDVGNNTGFVVVIARGQYNASLVREVLKASTTRAAETVEGFEVVCPEREFRVVCPSNDRLILIAGPRPETMPVQQVLAAFKGGKGGIESDADMKALLDSVDRTKRLWAVAKATDAYRQAPVLAPFDTMTLVADEKGDETQFTLVAKGKDADRIKAAVEIFENGRQQALTAMKEKAPEQAKPLLKGIVDFLESVKTAGDGTSVTVTAVFKGGPAGVFGVMPILFGFASVRHAEAVRVQPPPPMQQEAVPSFNDEP